MWLIAGFWNAVSLPLLFVQKQQVSGPDWVILLIYLFPLIGVGLVVTAVQATRQWLRFGVTELSLDPYPGSIGGQVGGSLLLARSLGGSSRVTTTLECVYSYLTGSGEDRTRREEVLWQGRGPAASTASEDGLRIEFCFDVPEGLPMSEDKSGSYHLWRLQVESGTGRQRFDRTFELPVFPTSEQASNISTNTLALGRAAAERFIDDALIDPDAQAELRAKSGLSVEVRDDWIRLLFHYGRKKSLAMGLLLFGSVFAAAGWLIAGDASGSILASIIQWVFVVAGATVFGIGVYLPLNRLDVRIGSGEIRMTRAFCGIAVQRKTVQAATITGLDIDTGATSTSGTKTTVYYKLIGRREGGDVCLAEGITNRQFLEALRDRLLRFADLEAA